MAVCLGRTGGGVEGVRRKAKISMRSAVSNCPRCIIAKVVLAAATRLTLFIFHCPLLLLNDLGILLMNGLDSLHQSRIDTLTIWLMTWLGRLLFAIFSVLQQMSRQRWSPHGW